MISKEKHLILVERYERKRPKLALKKRKEAMEVVTPLSNERVKSLDGYSFTMTLPNKKQFVEPLEALKKDESKGDLGGRSCT
jgi:hypothetical protein